MLPNKRLSNLVNEDVKRRLDEWSIPVLNAGLAAMDYYSNKGDDVISHANEGDYLVNIVNDINSTLQKAVQAGEIPQTYYSYCQPYIQRMQQALQANGIQAYDNNKFNWKWSYLDPTGGLVSGLVNGIRRKSNGGNFFG